MFSSSEHLDSSTNGDRRKERYGVMSDCATEILTSLHILLDGDGTHHLKVVQEAHIGIAERDLPLRA
jgi:hypothetical protein